MQRRDFLKTSSLAGLSLPAMAWTRDSRGAAPEPIKDFELNEATIQDLQARMVSGAWTARTIAEAYLKRIDQIDKNGPKLNAVIELNPDALSIADGLDKERKGGKIRGPLHGIPILIKDNIDSGDKMMTTAGALAMVGNHASRDAFIVERLRAAGAVLLGKTNLSEWANFRSERSTSGWSSRGGQTHCPYILDRNPSGSSAGSGSSAATSLCAIAIGTETNGSIVSPSSVNGLVGIKPTVGLWSRSGIIPISASQDTAGPMARCVRDAATLLGPLAGVDDRDPATAASAGQRHDDYRVYLSGNGLKGKKIGVEKAHLEGHEGVVALYRAAIEVLKAQGAEVVEVELLKLQHALGHSEFLILQYEFKDGVNKYLAGANAQVKNLSDVIAFNKANEAKAMPYFKQETLESSDKKGDLNSQEYKDSLAKVVTFRKAVDDLMATNGLHAICGVTNGPACCIDLIAGDYDTGFSFSSPAAIAGYPHITLPMGTVMGLPIGFSFMAGAYQEPVILDMAYTFEQAMPKRPVPVFEKQFPV